MPPKQPPDPVAELLNHLMPLPARRRLGEIEHILHELGRRMPDDILAPAEPLLPGRHYPEGEVWDQTTGAQWFFHDHAETYPPGLHGPESAFGHFHAFLGAPGIPHGLSPLILPEMAMAPADRPRDRIDPGTHLSRRDRGHFAHLAGLRIDRSGTPVALFSTNRWVTGEVWYRAEDTIRMLDRFTFRDSDPNLLGSLWLAAIFEILRPQLKILLRQRDAAIMDWRRRRSHRRHVFEDERLAIAATLDIDFPALLRG